MLELAKELTPEELEQASRDKQTSYVVKVVQLQGGTDQQELAITAALDDIDRRAKRANMQAFQPAFVPIASDTPNFCRVVILCQWIDREKLEKLQRQQALMGQQGGIR